MGRSMTEDCAGKGVRFQLFEEPVYPASFWPLTGSQAGAGSEDRTVLYLIGLKQSGAAPAKAPLLLCLLWPTGKNAAKSCRQASSTSSTKPRHDRAPSTMKSKPQFAPFLKKRHRFFQNCAVLALVLDPFWRTRRKHQKLRCRSPKPRISRKTVPFRLGATLRSRPFRTPFVSRVANIKN